VRGNKKGRGFKEDNENRNQTKFHDMTDHIITFAPDGTARCLWTEAVPLHELGRLEIHRATKIEFNNATQHWEVKDRKCKARFFAKARSACLDWEQQNLQPK
jgi:hypothetical protein